MCKEKKGERKVGRSSTNGAGSLEFGEVPVTMRSGGWWLG